MIRRLINHVLTNPDYYAVSGAIAFFILMLASSIARAWFTTDLYP